MTLVSSMSELLNSSTLLDLAGDDKAPFLEIVNDFQENGQDIIRKIKAAILNEDLESVKGLAHQLKGSSGTLGMERLFELCKTLESSSLLEIGAFSKEELSQVFQKSVKAAKETLSD